MNIVLLGATGAVGGQVLNALLTRAEVEVSRVTVLARRLLDVSHPKLAVHVTDVLSPQSYAAHVAGHDAAICTFGVGEPTKVSREEFRRIDYDAVLAFAQACKEQGVRHFELLNSVGADPRSRSFYLRSKGELRDAIAALNFARFSCFQPSMLLTPENRYGLSQALLLAAWPVVSPLLIGGLQKYRGVRIATLGHAMAANLFIPGGGLEVLHWAEFNGHERPQ